MKDAFQTIYEITIYRCYRLDQNSTASEWLVVNKLILNKDKTQNIDVTNRQHLMPIQNL